MTYTRPGELFLGSVDGQEHVVYLSLMTDEKGIERRDHCFRYAPPSNAIVVGKVKFVDNINQLNTWRGKKTRQQSS